MYGEESHCGWTKPKRTSRAAKGRYFCSSLHAAWELMGFCYQRLYIYEAHESLWCHVFQVYIIHSICGISDIAVTLPFISARFTVCKAVPLRLSRLIPLNVFAHANSPR